MMHKDLTPLAKELEEVFKKHFPEEKERIALAISFALPRDQYKQVYFVTSVPRTEGIRMFRGCADKMQGKLQ